MRLPVSVHWFFRKMMTGWVPLAPARVTLPVTGADRAAAADCAAPSVAAAAAGPAPAEAAATASAEHTPAAASAPEMTLPLPRMEGDYG
jgi:hypothetical protein